MFDYLDKCLDNERVFANVQVACSNVSNIISALL